MLAVRAEDGAAIGQRVQASAVVTRVDAATRTVVLRGEDGRQHVLTAGPQVRNFDQIKVGDVLKADFVEAVALDLQKRGNANGIRQRIETDAVAPAPEGQRGGAVGREVVLVADVQAVNTLAQTVTLRGVGPAQTLKVRSPAMLNDLRVGDQVQVRFVEALALSLEPARKP